MKFLNGGNVVRLPVGEIVVEERLRAVREDNISTLILMAEDTGITTPIHVRKVKDRLVLIDGAHRLEATKRMGSPDIAALLVECRADEARAMEASNNLGAARMTPLETAVFVASWKRDYYALHPEREQGVFKGNQYTGKVVGINLSLTKIIADAFGVSEPTIKRALQAGDSLSLEEAAQLDAAPCRITMEDLKHLSKISDPDERAQVILKLSGGNAKNAATARRQWKVEQGLAAPVQDPVEAGLKALKTAWSRAPKEARRRFIRDHGADIEAILYEGSLE
ncbi:ParB/RepB/Spo0J family partition protein [Pararhodobacter sp.]|uniref:ParB/RepB/Spo0J family partition protein n=1 Tax=Pararhodobacter sp. TaxID=2127056 RepID=UPI002AFE36A4|nr:ParB N-terminal domain-containing protein [Pararhodobacter sp.]